MVLDDRQKAHLNKHRQDEEKDFRVTARRNKLLGLWAAEKLGLADDTANDYAKEVINADFEEPGDEDVIRKIMADFTAKNVAVTEETVRAEITRLHAVAREQIESTG